MGGPDFTTCPCGEPGCVAILCDDTFCEEGQPDEGFRRPPDESLLSYKQRKIRDGYSMMPASDDWHPCFPSGLVAVGFFPLKGGGWRVCVWGADDSGMEQDFEDEEVARRCRQELPIVISREDLRHLGFRPA